MLGRDVPGKQGRFPRPQSELEALAPTSELWRLSSAMSSGWAVSVERRYKGGRTSTATIRRRLEAGPVNSGGAPAVGISAGLEARSVRS